VQSRARTDATELQTTINDKDALKLVVEKVKLETQEEKQRANNLEQKLKEVFTRYPENVKEVTSSVEEHIQIIT
jgi:hypothetical protein